MMSSKLKSNDSIENFVRFDNISEDLFGIILDKIFNSLTFTQEALSISGIDLDEVSQKIHSCLLTLTAEFVRNNTHSEDIEEILKTYSVSTTRVKKYLEYFYKYRMQIQFSLSNIGTFLPHLTEVRWKMDFVIKSSMMEDSTGPLFKVSLIAEEYDINQSSNVVKQINFVCTSPELQDLVYKLKDAIRHCNTVTNRGN